MEAWTERMTWLAIKLTFQRVTIFVKEHWKIMLLAVWSTIVWFLSRRDSEAAIAAMAANKESYDAQIKSLKSHHKEEVQKIQDLHLKYQETLAKIEDKYKKKKEQLTHIEKKRVKQIVKKAKDNPDEIDKKIEDLFGFTPSS